MKLRPTTRRHGLTLVELLVVIIIISTLVATVIPLMVPTVEERRVREAARGVSTFISGARARALELGRPVGVMIERLPAENGAGATLSYVEVPAPFSGFSFNSALRMQTVSGSSPGYYVCRAKLVSESLPPRFIRVLDRLRLNHQGREYVITGPDTDRDSFVDPQAILELRVFVESQGTLPWPWRELPDPPVEFSNPMPFQILRQAQRTAAAPFQLPDGTAIDLSASGFEIDDRFHDLYLDNQGKKRVNNNSFPITFLFGSTGRLKQVSHDIGTDAEPDPHPNEPIRATLHLLIGKRENIPPPEAAQAVMAPETANWMDPENLWVSVGHMSGQVATSQVAPQRGATDIGNQLAEARRYAAEMRSTGTP